jgi:hypothetical protein
MSGHGNDWSQWGELWRDQPAVDVSRLARAASRKRWRMRVMVALELLTSAVACVQCLRFMSITTGRWQIWSIATLAFMLVLQWLYLHVRRGTWQASGDDVRSLLQLTLQRAAAGVRLAKINLWSTVAWVMLTVLVSVPELEPSRWQADPKLKWILVLQFAVNAPLILAIIVFCLWYIRRQRARIARMRELLKADQA